MKKYMEIMVDEDGHFHFSTDERSISGNDVDLRQMENELLRMTEAFVQECWGKRNQVFNQLIRKLSMAEALSCAQPYSMVEDYWSTMMFSTIPNLEKKAARMKEPFGFRNKEVIRPKVFSPGMSMFPIGMKDNWN